MWKVNRPLVLVLLFLSRWSFAQFANDWIDYSQSYYKIQITEDDFYRLTSAELAAVGFPVTTVPASRIQLFRNGTEVAIWEESNPDGTLDYLEFWGEGPDGNLDAPLYNNGGQPHQFRNLFSDTAAYFLTYKLGNETGKRMAFSSDNDANGLTAEPYHIAEELQVFFNGGYSRGIQFGTESAFSLSEYDEGEGWTGTFVNKGGSTTYDFVLENLRSDIDPICDYALIGGNSLSHNATINAGADDSNLTFLGSTEFSGWGMTVDEFTIPSSSIGTEGQLSIQVFREGYPDLADRFAVSYMRVKYPQEMSMSASENKVFTLDNPPSRAFVQVATTNAAGTSVYDINDPDNPIFMTSSNFSSRLEVIIPSAVNEHKMVAVTGVANVASVSPVAIQEPNLDEKNYIIITHKDLQASGDPVNEYKVYRESIAGGEYEVSIITIDQVFDQFGYGSPTPLAIKNYLEFAASVTNPEYVFLIGKGYTPNYDHYRNQPEEINIPTFGLPGSDLLYTEGINASENYPGIPIGRLNAYAPDDVLAYLNKVVEMEALPFDELWRKDFLQLSGGSNQTELNTFANYVQDFTTTLEEDFIGGRAFNTGKETSEAVEFINIADRVNQGVGYVTFFGHSSGATTDIEIGIVSDPGFGFQNTSRYPIFLVNGCKAGEIFVDAVTFGEDWILTPNLGAIGFIAHADNASASALKRWSDLYYDLAFGDDLYIGESIGNIMIEVSKRYFDTYGIGDINLTQVDQMLLQGDPSIRVFGADYPDYQIEDESLFAESLTGDVLLVSQDTFNLNIVVKNFGRTIQDSVIVQVNRILPDGTSLTYINEFLRPLRQDTLSFLVPNDPSYNNQGQNVFNVTIDPANSVEELNESNNVATMEAFIFNGNTSHLLPIDDAIVGSNQVELVWQSSNINESAKQYDIEIDSDIAFNSPNRRTFTVTSGVIGRLDLDLSTLGLPDETTYYWRSKFSDSEDTEWVTSSFTVIDGSAEGWGQFELDQLDNTTVSGVGFDDNTQSWEFIETTTSLAVSTFGADHPTFQYEDQELLIGGVNYFATLSPLDPFCRSNTLNAVVFDLQSGLPYAPLDEGAPDYNNDQICGRGPQRINNFTENEVLTSRRLKSLIDSMSVGDEIVFFNIGEIAYSNWDADVVASLNEVGITSTTIENLVDGQPIIFLGKKGDAPGTAIEIVTDGSADPNREQSIELTNSVFGSFTSGLIKTENIGPALDWSSYTFDISEEVNDVYLLSVLGIDQEGNEESIPSLERSRTETLDLSSIDENTYPSLALSFSFEDETDLDPAQFNSWSINYSLPPEGIALPVDTALSVLEGQELEPQMMFYNLSSVDFSDSLNAEVSMINTTSGNTSTSVIKIAPIAAGDTAIFSTRFSSFGYAGLNSLAVNVLPNENEMYAFNNQFTLANVIEVQSDETNPVLDVTFDGNHILDGDIVSPNPRILVRMRDDNPFVFKSDTTGVNVSLLSPGEGAIYERISFSDPSLSYTAAEEGQDFEIDYQPGPLADGIYGLRVQAEDETGNEAGIAPYEITFEVINESTVTHFYPYPNPFSSSCRFVFTLTGSEIPDQLKIQIMTVSGRIVREITQDEIGPIQIGNNITEYAWDGRDEFGDRLANGVYFYKVFVNSNGESIEHRTTSADRAFKHGFGKLYILR